MRPLTICATLLLLLSGCRNQPPPPVVTHPTVITVEQLVASPQAFHHQIITVRGCFIHGFERSTLEPCSNARHGDMIWLQDAAPAYWLERHSLPGLPSAEPLELRTKPQSEFLFDFDEGKNRAAWNRLLLPSKSSYVPVEATLTGQFETVIRSNPAPQRIGYGHLGAFSHELILIDARDVAQIAEPKLRK